MSDLDLRIDLLNHRVGDVLQRLDAIDYLTERDVPICTDLDPEHFDAIAAFGALSQRLALLDERLDRLDYLTSCDAPVYGCHRSTCRTVEQLANEAVQDWNHLIGRIDRLDKRIGWLFDGWQEHEDHLHCLQAALGVQQAAVDAVTMADLRFVFGPDYGGGDEEGDDDEQGRSVVS